MSALCVSSSDHDEVVQSSLPVRLETPSLARGRWRTSCFGFFCLVSSLLGNSAAQSSATQLDRSINQRTPLERRFRDGVPAYTLTLAEPIEQRNAPRFEDFQISQKCAEELVQ